MDMSAATLSSGGARTQFAAPAEAEAEGPSQRTRQWSALPPTAAQRAQHSTQLTRSTRDVKASKTCEQRDDGATQDTEWAGESSKNDLPPA